MANFNSVSHILLVAPNPSNERIEKISELAGDLIYAISILGITGNDLASKSSIAQYLNRVRKYSSTPFVVGFGISSRDDVLWFNDHADGAVVGSAIIKNMDGHTKPLEATKQFIQALKGNS